MLLWIFVTLLGISNAAPSVNIALGKPAYQSSVAGSGVPSRAVDGNSSVYYPQGSCTHTTNDVTDKTGLNWWAVDLQGRYDVEAVTLTNRAECCSDRLSNFVIMVIDNQPINGQLLNYTPSDICAIRGAEVAAGATERFDCVGTGRYVAVVTARFKPLTLCEVEVFGVAEADSNGADVAFGKPTSQYDVSSGGVSSRAVDGNRNGVYNIRSCTHTTSDVTDDVNRNWWAVDLLATYKIKSVAITNRVGCCSDRLSDFEIVLSHHPANGEQPSYLKSDVCARKSSQIGAGATEVFECRGEGRVVAIVRSRAKPLTLCEVQVFGVFAMKSHRDDNLALNKPTFQFDVSSRGVPSRAVDGNKSAIYTQESCTHTTENASDIANNNWWAVDLLRQYDIQGVALTNRVDCCSDRLADFEIVVLDAQPANGQALAYTQDQVCSNGTGKAPVQAGMTILFDCKSQGRYVAVVRSRFKPLTLCEVEVFGLLVEGQLKPDLALKKPAFQFDVTYGGVPSRAVNGNYDTVYDSRSCTHTSADKSDDENNNFWAVDLGARYDLEAVALTNRVDCCIHRLANFRIVVLDEQPTNGRKLSYKTCQVCARKSGNVAAGSTEKFTCRKTGRYVAVVRNRDTPLTLCEVQVFGFPTVQHEKGSNLALGRSTMQSDVSSKGVPSRAVDGNSDSRYRGNSCTHTTADAADTEGQNWWAVDMGENKLVSEVALTNRGDCCSERLMKFDIVLLDVQPIEGQRIDYELCNICASRALPLDAGQRMAFSCHGSGRYVAVVQPRTQSLTLCEVEVFGNDEAVASST